MGNVVQLVRDEDASALGASGRLHDPLLVAVALHRVLQVYDLVRQNECLGQELKMLLAVNFTELRHLSVHKIFACHVEAAGEVVHLLVLVKTLVDLLLDRAYSPVNRPLSGVILWVVEGLLGVSEPVVFKCVSDNLDIVLFEVEVVASVLWLVRLDGDRVFVCPEH